jgi:katanin p80 WD40 repeat-containing subunit B1
VRRKSCISTYKGHTKGISVIRFSPDGRWLCSGAEVLDHCMIMGPVYHLEDVDSVTYDRHVRFQGSSRSYLTTSLRCQDGTVKLWDLAAGKLMQAFLHPLTTGGA